MIAFRRGFTFVEAIMVTVIAVVVMLAVQNIFSHAVKSSLKGQDNLDSIRAASRILSELRKDLLEFKTIATEVGTVEIPVGVDAIGAGVIYSSILFIEKKEETVTYSINEVGDKMFVEKVTQRIGASPKKESFGVPRMKAFEVVYVKIENSSPAGSEFNGQLIVKLVVQSDDPRFPSKKIAVSSAFFPEKLQDSDWNYLSF